MKHVVRNIFTNTKLAKCKQFQLVYLIIIVAHRDQPGPVASFPRGLIGILVLKPELIGISSNASLVVKIKPETH